jgi:hypothetical protein
MRNSSPEWPLRAGLAGVVAVLAFAALASVGAAVSPSATATATATAAASEQHPKKVTICHKTGSKKKPFRTIRVSLNAVKAHLRHGDSVRSCSASEKSGKGGDEGKPAETPGKSGEKGKGPKK